MVLSELSRREPEAGCGAIQEILAEVEPLLADADQLSTVEQQNEAEAASGEVAVVPTSQGRSDEDVKEEGSKATPGGGKLTGPTSLSWASWMYGRRRAALQKRCPYCACNCARLSFEKKLVEAAVKAVDEKEKVVVDIEKREEETAI